LYFLYLCAVLLAVARKSGQSQVSQRDLGRWKLLQQWEERLAKAAQGRILHPTFEDNRRKLSWEKYLSLFLFGLLNPVVRTMRGLCAASHLPRVAKEVCGRSVSLGSFSETQHVLDREILEKVFNDLGKELHQERLAQGGLKGSGWLIQDSTLWEALPRMNWALWRKQGTTQNAVRLHLGLHVLEDKPVRAKVTIGAYCERKAWKETWQEGDAYIGDRNYGSDFKIFGRLNQKHCTYILRLTDRATIHVEEELPVTQEDRAQGVIRQAWAHLGSQICHRSVRVRLVWVQGPEEVLVLVTNQSPEDLSAALVSQFYRCRWHVELSFRWIKCILGCRHWLAESPEGVAIQIYLALIAALLLQLYSGERPTKRMMELIQFYLLGYASLDELEAGLEKEKARLARKKSK
jgi:hypothetical protein